MLLRVSLFLCSLLVIACDSNAPGSAESRTDDASGGLTFLHLNDTYRIAAVEDGTRGGFGRVTTVIRELQEQGRDVHLLHGGDFLYPSLESQLWDGQQMIDAFNFMHRLAPLTAVIGNHETDRRSVKQLADALIASEFGWVGGNIRVTSGQPDVDSRVRDTSLIDVGNRQVGVFGLTLLPPDGGNDRDYLEYDDYLDSARRSLDQLSAQGVDIIIGLTHLHMEDDRRISALRAEYPNFVLIAGGHEHEPEHQAPEAGRAEIVKGASNARSIWRIDVEFDPDGRPTLRTELIELDAAVTEDAEYALLAARWRERLLETIPFLPAKIGEAAVPFDAREVTIRNRESNWGNFVVDQMRTAFGDEPPADLAFLNSGTLRIDDYIAGDITFEDVARTFGFSSFLHYLEMSGEEFRSTLEAGYRGAGPSKGYFPRVSGFRVCIDRTRPEGSRIVQLQIPDDGGWGAIDASASYLVVAPEYLVGGGDGYQFPAGRASRPGSELRYLVLDAIVSAQARGEAVGREVDPQNPRIAFAQPGELCFPQ